MHNEKGHEDPPILVRYLTRALHRTGLFVADHHYLVLVITLSLTAFCSIKIVFTPQEDDIKTGYTPFGSRSIHEMQVYNDFFVYKGDPIAVFVLISAKDGGSMHRREHMNEAMQVMDYVSTNISHKGSKYYEICSNWCLINEPLQQFAMGVNLEAQGNSSLLRVKLNFPMMEIMGKQLDLSPNLFGVQKDENGKVTYLRVIGAQYRAEVPKGWTADDVKAYERKVSKYIHSANTTLIDAYGTSLTYMADEIVRTGMTVFPYIAVGFLIMCTFSVLTVLISSFYLKQPFRDRISMAILGCVCPLLATSTALGFLFWMGFRFGSILCVTPFLILAIGVDDAYLTIQSWIRLRSLPIPHREKIAAVLVDVGPSISITSLTNLLAFAVGIYTPTPEIQLFCAGNLVAIVADFIYQMTMYMAIVSIAGQKEMEDEEKRREEKDVQKGKEEVEAPKEGNVTIIPVNRQSFIAYNTATLDMEDSKLSLLLEAYSEWLANGFTSIIIAICLCFYWWFSIHGALSIKIILSPDKLVLEDSKMIQINYLREHYISPNYTVATIFFGNPGDLDNPDQLHYVKSAVESFESLPECLGAQFSRFWIRDYESFIQAGGNEEEEEMMDSNENMTSLGIFNKHTMEPFLEWPEFQHLSQFIRFYGNGTIRRFFVNVAYHGDHLGNFDGHGVILKKWRETADEYKSIQVDIFDDNAQFIDQVETMLPATLSTSFTTLGCMVIVCFLFMYNAFTVIVASTSIASICIGVFGMLSYWGIDLDPISMATTIMSIGFSVDFPAHVTYHYFREGLEDPQASPSKRIARALVAIGFPLMQCGLSTILFVCCLLFVKTYMSEVFFKTMILVVSLGLIHGLMVVPVFLCALTNLYYILFEKSPDTQSLSSFARILRWGGVTPSTSDNKIPSA